MEKQYITILIESLQKKSDILSELIKNSEKQAELLKENTVDWDAFDQGTDAKSDLIDTLNQLDQGFETVFTHVSELLQSPEGKKAYAQQIKILQDLITEVTDKSITLQADEARNKASVEKRFQEYRAGIRKGRTSSKVAYGYYQNMNQLNYLPPQFLDNKK
ncbi:flagellar export chaperone FlgN [Kineothrix sp. MSJ-39]|uniref:flagellar export chaperone FlgN n=1 Tax=Kineothrix sp. MSJ-39 TaxID=2841533 RepID=UPI001C0FBD3C|nr:flagellar export chaperone FlgN [Kineothrix sp. MSJ-39]MBU5429486.1 flagellar export chaperone FlgN [Kineothrix sp. MSJ-39]